MTNDNVNQPDHYLQSSMECIEAIEGLSLDFHQAQVLKYVYRPFGSNTRA
jgi:hypothetical protein